MMPSILAFSLDFFFKKKQEDKNSSNDDEKEIECSTSEE
jgi:hypothetical protein